MSFINRWWRVCYGMFPQEFPKWNMPPNVSPRHLGICSDMFARGKYIICVFVSHSLFGNPQRPDMHEWKCDKLAASKTGVSFCSIQRGITEGSCIKWQNLSLQIIHCGATTPSKLPDFLVHLLNCPCFLHIVFMNITTLKTNMTMKKEPFEDAFPSKNGGFPASHVSFLDGRTLMHLHFSRSKMAELIAFPDGRRNV